MVITSDLYSEFVSDLAIRTFGTDDIDWFIGNGTDGHRSQRVLDMLLLIDKETFDKYKVKAPSNYARIANALFSKTGKSFFCHMLCKDFISKYNIEQPANVTVTEGTKQVIKGLDSYVIYRLKQENAVALER